MLTMIDEGIQNYIDKFLPSPDLIFQEIEAWTRSNTDMPQMLSGHYQAQLLSFLANLTPCRNILEIGTFTGYTSLYLAAHTKAEFVYSLEFSPAHVKTARTFHRKHPAGSKIQIIEGSALESLKQLAYHQWDFIFIDADKENYVNYFEAVKNNLTEHGIIVADNVLWSGKVSDAKNIEPSTVALRKFNEHVATQPDFSSIILAVRDGLNVIKKKKH